MAGYCQFHCKDFHSTLGQKFPAVRLVKDVMVQAAVVDVVNGTALKLLCGAGPRIKADVVFFQDFRQVGQIVLKSVPLKSSNMCSTAVGVRRWSKVRA